MAAVLSVFSLCVSTKLHFGSNEIILVESFDAKNPEGITDRLTAFLTLKGQSLRAFDLAFGLCLFRASGTLPTARFSLRCRRAGLSTSAQRTPSSRSMMGASRISFRRSTSPNTSPSLRPRTSGMSIGWSTTWLPMLWKQRADLFGLARTTMAMSSLTLLLKVGAC